MARARASVECNEGRMGRFCQVANNLVPLRNAGTSKYDSSSIAKSDKIVVVY